MYVVFEGANGVGKSTQIPLVQELLKKLFDEYGEKNIHINTFHEGELAGECDDRIEEILSYALDRLKLQTHIYDRSNRNITLADRSYYSSMVYQNTGKGDEIYIRFVNIFAIEPDLIIYLWNNEHKDLEKDYLDVLPYGVTELICTTDTDIKEITNYICDEIFTTWLRIYQNKNYDEANSIYQDLLSKVEGT